MRKNTRDQQGVVDERHQFELALIERLVEKYSQPDPSESSFRPGLDVLSIIGELAILQESRLRGSEPIHRLHRRAARLLLNLIGRDRASRERISIILLAAEPIMGINHIINVRARRPSEKPKTVVRRERRRDPDWRIEVIGRAVLQEYIKNGRKSLDAAINDVADRQIIEGIATGQSGNVSKRYKAYRKIAFARGFADIRNLNHVIFGVDPPSDAVFLRDFPPE